MKKIVLFLLALLLPWQAWGAIIYVGSSTEGIAVVDKEGDNFSIKKIVPINGEIKSIHHVNHYLYVAAGLGGLYIFDVTSPENPVLLAHYDTRGFSMDTGIYKNIIYEADFEDGVKIFTISGRELKKLNTLKTLDMAMSIRIRYPYLIVANSNNGILLYNIKDPVHPKFIRSIDTPGVVWDIEDDGKYIYAAMKSGIAIYDFSRPPYADLKKQIKPGGIIFKVRKIGNYLFALETNSGIHEGEEKNKGLLIYDISNPVEPKKILEFSKYLVSDFIPEGNQVILALEGMGLAILDISKLDQPEILKLFNIGDDAVDVWCNSNVAVVADMNGGAKVIDISNPASARISSYITTEGKVLQVCGEGTRAFIPDKKRGVLIYNVADPYHPRLENIIKKKGAISLRCKGNYLYVLYENYGIKIYQINPKPYWVTELLSGGKQIYDIAVGQDRLYLSEGWDGVSLIDIKKLTNPRPTGHLATINEAKGIAARGTYFFVARTGAGLLIGDAEDVYNLFEKSHVNLNVNGYAVKLFGNYAFFSALANGLYIIDITNIDKPYVISHLKTPGEVKNSYLSGTKLCVADGWNGFVLADFSKHEFTKIVSDLMWFVPTAISK